MIVLHRPSRLSHRCELFRTGAKVPFCLDFAMIYAFVPRAANTKLAFRVNLPTIFRARTVRDIYETSMSRRPCNDLRVRTASSTIPAGTNMIYLSTPPRIRIGTKSFEPVRTCDSAESFHRFNALAPLMTAGAICIWRKPCNDVRAHTAFDCYDNSH